MPGEYKNCSSGFCFQLQEPDIQIAERCLPNPNVRRCLETSRIGPQQLVFAKGIEGAELSGGAVIVSEGGRIGGEVIVVQ